MGHRQLCFRCDELLIDLEMEIAPDDAKDGVDLELRGGGEEGGFDGGNLFVSSTPNRYFSPRLLGRPK